MLVRVLAALAIVAGLGLTGLGLYKALDSEEAEKPPSLSSKHRTDPGGVYDRPVASATPGPVAAAPAPEPAPPPPAAPIEAPLRDAPYNMIIERIGVNAGVFTFGVDRNRVPEVPLNGYDIAWYNFSARPGTGGNAVFAGHVTWGGPAVFHDLDYLKPGDRIVLRSGDGTELAYVVSETFLVDADDPNSLWVMKPTSNDVITVITCGGSFFYTGDPVANGDYTHRRVVRAKLSGITQPGPAA